MEIGWEDWQLSLLEDYIFGYTAFNTIREVAAYLNKTENAVKIRLTRLRQAMEKGELEAEKRKLSLQEYIYFLSNRFSKTSIQISESLNLSHTFFLEQIDELDCFECKEYLQDEFKGRLMTDDEYEIFIKLYKTKKRDKVYIAHCLNRSIGYIEELIKEYEAV